eukprot:13259215-Heterocapsa_arctica.AAC.1
MFSSDLGQFASGRNSPDQGFWRIESTLVEFHSPLSDFTLSDCHPNSVDIRKDSNGSELSVMFSTFFGNEGNDGVKA